MPPALLLAIRKESFKLEKTGAGIIPHPERIYYQRAPTALELTTIQELLTASGVGGECLISSKVVVTQAHHNSVVVDELGP